MVSEIWVGRVNRVMDYVRDHVGHRLTLEELSRVAFSSPYHFHRVFRAVTGETLAGFVRRSRLERAAYLMKARPRRPLTSIALEVGFPSSSEFSRAFRRTYGVAPSRWDRRSRLDPPGQNVRAARRPDAYDGYGFDARMVQRAPSRIAFVRVKTHFDVNDLAIGLDRLVQWLERRSVDWRLSQLVGMSWDNYETTPLGQLHYDLGFIVSPDVVADGEFGIRELPAFTAVEVHCQGTLGQIAHAWDYLYEAWLPHSVYEPADLPAMKWFRRRPDEIGWERWDVDCSIPVRRALG